ncbi:MAG: Rrf2 family transcriptional regulator [Deltaproteobacteria bacterium]|nr:Rrf2 family transcriptional regulator [Deltaproteobacteria bacterium]
MKLNKVADYAIRSVVNLAMKNNKELVTIKEIAQEEEIPRYFLAKVIPPLVNAGIVKGYRGRDGGVSLSKDARLITLKDVIEAVNGPIIMTRCTERGDTCHKGGYCAVHLSLEETQRTLISKLESYTIGDLAQKYITGEEDRGALLLSGKGEALNAKAA